MLLNGSPLETRLKKVLVILFVYKKLRQSSLTFPMLEILLLKGLINLIFAPRKVLPEGSL
jgi:hypothetical protein